MFADQIQPVARRMPWMTVGGNHERDWPDSGDRYGNVLDSGELQCLHTEGPLLLYLKAMACTLYFVAVAGSQHMWPILHGPGSAASLDSMWQHAPHHFCNLNMGMTGIPAGASAGCRTSGASRCLRRYC